MATGFVDQKKEESPMVDFYGNDHRKSEKQPENLLKADCCWPPAGHIIPKLRRLPGTRRKVLEGKQIRGAAW